MTTESMELLAALDRLVELVEQIAQAMARIEAQCAHTNDLLKTIRDSV